MALRFPPVAQFLERFRAVLRRRRVFDFDGEVAGLSRVEQAVAFLALLELRKSGEIALAQAAPFAPIRVSRPETRKDPRSGPSAPPDLDRHDLGPDRRARAHGRGAARRRLAAADRRRARRRDPGRRRADRDRARPARASATARGAAASCSSRSSGGYAFRAAREAAEACGRLFERPVERGLSQAALETLAIVAYLGPVSRPEIARIRGVAADSAVASLVERGLIAEAGRESGPGRRRPLPGDAAVRARLRARQPRGAAAARRSRRRAGGDPRAAARGRRGARLVGCSLAAAISRASAIPAARIPACGGADP